VLKGKAHFLNIARSDLLALTAQLEKFFTRNRFLVLLLFYVDAPCAFLQVFVGEFARVRIFFASDARGEFFSVGAR
jgi:hypothetical protein